MQYRVQSGDTLGVLANRFRTNVPAIMRANAGRISNPNMIFVGQLIQIPTSVAQAKTGAAAISRQAAVARPAAAPRTSGGERGAEQQVLQLVNRERTSRGLRPLAYNAKLDQAAERHNAHMARVGVMSHQGIGDGTPGSRVRNAGWSGGYGENVAYGFASPKAVMNVWMNSPGHRAAILRPDFTHMAVSRSISPKNGLPYWTQVFGAR